jgi:hypothetical protein
MVETRCPFASRYRLEASSEALLNSARCCVCKVPTSWRSRGRSAGTGGERDQSQYSLRTPVLVREASVVDIDTYDIVTIDRCTELAQVAAQAMRSGLYGGLICDPRK